jgi:DNA-binding NarL/FixJ family response regulator
MSTKQKILLAEDDPCLSRYIETLLSQWDCDVAVEQTAERAIRRASLFKPDVVLLGFITQPGMDGAKSWSRVAKGFAGDKGCPHSRDCAFRSIRRSARAGVRLPDARCALQH